MCALFTLLFMFVCVGDSAKDANPGSQPYAATSQPAVDVEFRPERIIDHRVKDLSDLFPAKPAKPAAVQPGAGGFKIRLPARSQETSPRPGLTIRFALSGGTEDCEMFLKKVSVDEVSVDEGDWPDPFKRAWIEDICLDESDVEERLRFFHQHDLDDEDGALPRSYKVDLDFRRTPRQARLISKLRGSLELEVTTLRTTAIDLDQVKIGERVASAELKQLGLKLKIIDPKKTEYGNRDDISSGRYTAAELSGSLERLVSACVTEPPAREGEIAGPKLPNSEYSSSSSSSFFGSGGKRTSVWRTETKRPQGARLVLRVITSRRTHSHSFLFEEISLPK